LAAINDNSGVVTGPVLDAWNEMQARIQRDGDTVGAAETLRQTFIRICHTKQTAIAGATGTTTVRRS
jgi:hypothetical protein